MESQVSLRHPLGHEGPKTFEEWLAYMEANGYPDVRLTRTRNMLRAAWFASAELYNARIEHLEDEILDRSYEADRK